MIALEIRSGQATWIGAGVVSPTIRCRRGRAWPGGCSTLKLVGELWAVATTMGATLTRAKWSGKGDASVSIVRSLWNDCGPEPRGLNSSQTQQGIFSSLRNDRPRARQANAGSRPSGRRPRPRRAPRPSLCPVGCALAEFPGHYRRAPKALPVPKSPPIPLCAQHGLLADGPEWVLP